MNYVPFYPLLMLKGREMRHKKVRPGGMHLEEVRHGGGVRPDSCSF